MEHRLSTYFEALYQIVLRVSSSLNLDEVLAYLAEETARSLDAKAASVRLLDESGEFLEMRAVYGLSEAYLNKGHVTVAQSPVDQAILGGQPMQVADVGAEVAFQYPAEAAQEGIVSIASVPLQAHGRPIGVLRVYSGHRRTFTDDEMRFLVAVADVAALSIENARLYEESQAQYTDTMNLLWG